MLQAVSKDALTEDGQLAYWLTRYTLRTAAAGTAGTSVPPAAVGAARQQQGQQQGEVEQDVPVFLLAHTSTILTTGARVH